MEGAPVPFTRTTLSGCREKVHRVFGGDSPRRETSQLLSAKLNLSLLIFNLWITSETSLAGASLRLHPRAEMQPSLEGKDILQGTRGRAGEDKTARAND